MRNGNSLRSGNSYNKRKDDTWNVKIKVTLNRKRAHIDTQHYVVRKQLKKDYSIKDQFILDALNPLLKIYRDKISALGDPVYLRKYFVNMFCVVGL